MNFQKKKTHWNIKVIFTVGHLHVPYEWITLMPINTSDTSHNPEIYQVFHSDFQLIMSYTSFSLNSLHAGSISCFLELQVSDSGGGRYSIRRDSPPEKGCGIQRASTEGCGWLCNKGQIQVPLLQGAEMGCVRMCVESTLYLFEQQLWSVKKEIKTMHLTMSFTWVYKNLSFCLKGALNSYQRKNLSLRWVGSWNRINLSDINLNNVSTIRMLWNSPKKGRIE